MFGQHTAKIVKTGVAGPGSDRGVAEMPTPMRMRPPTTTTQAKTKTKRRRHAHAELAAAEPVRPSWQESSPANKATKESQTTRRACGKAAEYISRKDIQSIKHVGPN